MSQVPITNPLGNADTSGIAGNQQMEAQRGQERLLQTRSQDQQTKLAQMEIEDRKNAQVAEITARKKEAEARAEVEHAQLQARLLSEEKQSAAELGTRTDIADKTVQSQTNVTAAQAAENQKQRDFEAQQVAEKNARDEKLLERARVAAANRIKATQDLVGKTGPGLIEANHKVREAVSMESDLKVLQMKAASEEETRTATLNTSWKAFQDRLRGLTAGVITKGSGSRQNGVSAVNDGLASTIDEEFVKTEVPELDAIVTQEGRGFIQKLFPAAPLWTRLKREDPAYIGEVVAGARGKYLKKIGEEVEKNLLVSTQAPNVVGNVSTLMSMLWDASQATTEDAKGVLISKAQALADDIVKNSGDRVSMYDLSKAVEGVSSTLMETRDDRQSLEIIKKSQGGNKGMWDALTDESGKKQTATRLKYQNMVLNGIGAPLAEMSLRVFTPNKVDTPEEMATAETMVTAEAAHNTPGLPERIKTLAKTNFALSWMVRRADIEMGLLDRSDQKLEETKKDKERLEAKRLTIHKAYDEAKTQLEQDTQEYFRMIDPQAGYDPELLTGIGLSRPARAP